MRSRVLHRSKLLSDSSNIPGLDLQEGPCSFDPSRAKVLLNLMLKDNLLRLWNIMDTRQINNQLRKHALGHNGTEIVTFLPKTRLELGGFKDTTLNY